MTRTDGPVSLRCSVIRTSGVLGQERYGRPVGVVDDLIQQIQARQKSAAPSVGRLSRRREDEETVVGNDRSREEVSGSRRRKNRGGSNRNKHQVGAIPSHMHLMYREIDESELSHEGVDEERDNADA